MFGKVEKSIQRVGQSSANGVHNPFKACAKARNLDDLEFYADVGRVIVSLTSMEFVRAARSETPANLDKK